MFLINDAIKGDTYKKLIEYSFEKCNVVMFVFKKWGLDELKINKLNDTMNNLELNFRKTLITKINRPFWVFTECFNCKYSEDEFNSLFEIHFYKISETLKKYLLSNCDLYKWLNPAYPEDIAFFKDNVCWLSSVTHEKLCDICVENEKEYDYLKSIGIEFLETSFRKAIKKEIYVEKELENRL